MEEIVKELKTWPGSPEVLIEGDVPMVRDSIQGKLTVEWPLKSDNGTFIFDIDENKTEIRFEGKSSINWFLDLTTAQSVTLPFEKILPKQINSQFKGMKYSITTEKGIFDQPADKVKLRISPEKNMIILQLAQKNL